MLELVRFLKEHPTDCKSRLAAFPYWLKIKEKDNRVLFKYSQIDSDFNEKICREARGIILERDSWDIVSYAFPKFFNYGEPHADKINWESAVATEKIDGSIISVYFYGGEWKVATNGNIDAEDSDLSDACYSNFRQLFDVAAQNSGLDFSKLTKGFTYVFELVSPHNQIVISYDETELYHLATRNLETLEEVEVDIGVKKPQRFEFNNKSDYVKLVEMFNLDEEVKEGIVVRDNEGKRVKIKTTLYFELHRAGNNGNITDEYLLDLLRKNDTDEFLSYFPKYKTPLRTLQNKFGAFLVFVATTYNKVHNFAGLENEDEHSYRKRFAAWVKETEPNTKLASVYFVLSKGRDIKEWLDSLTNKKLLSFINEYYNSVIGEDNE